MVENELMFIKNYHLSKLLKTIANLFSYGFTLLVIIIWFTAFSNNNKVLLDINSIGEAIPELIMWVVIIPLFVYGMWETMKEMYLLRIWMREKWGYLPWISRIERLKWWI
jgi:hypothetical protein